MKYVSRGEISVAHMWSFLMVSTFSKNMSFPKGKNWDQILPLVPLGIKEEEEEEEEPQEKQQMKPFCKMIAFTCYRLFGLDSWYIIFWPCVQDQIHHARNLFSLPYVKQLHSGLFLFCNKDLCHILKRNSHLGT